MNSKISLIFVFFILFITFESSSSLWPLSNEGRTSQNDGYDLPAHGTLSFSFKGPYVLSWNVKSLTANRTVTVYYVSDSAYLDWSAAGFSGQEPQFVIQASSVERLEASVSNFMEKSENKYWVCIYNPNSAEPIKINYYVNFGLTSGNIAAMIIIICTVTGASVVLCAAIFGVYIWSRWKRQRFYQVMAERENIVQRQSENIRYSREHSGDSLVSDTSERESIRSRI
eukprot:TRINITY_DN12811_c0_g1_i1.p1 TRINITY_DN12811_c0_g1~~TRINITY_DN12811_c0_g1_i1.p1  ORF type:complete len:227 (+),score=60.15 TRINITY_DN12811_c0_g1_i1:52-732(+)